MAPREHDIVQATVWLINPIFGGVNRVTGVWVTLESFRVDNLIGELAADDKGITNNVPLASERIGQIWKNQDKAQAGGWTYSDPNR